MTWELLFVLGLLALCLGFLIWERFSPDVVAMGAMLGLLLTGILGPAEAFEVFSNQAVLTVICMFILSGALERTGVLDILGHRLDRWLGGGEMALLVVLLPFVALLSAFMNNTPVVMVLMPILISLARKRDIKPSKLLIPLSFASIFGGTCTLIGTSTNLLVNEVAIEHGQPALGMFELARAGVPLTVAGLAYLILVGWRILPGRDTLTSVLEGEDARQFLTEVVLGRESPLTGKVLTETPLKDLPQTRVLEVLRGDEALTIPLNKLVLQEGDRIRLSSALSSVVEVKKLGGVSALARDELGLEVVATKKAMLVECLVAPRSKLIGRTIRQANLRNRYGVLILAVHRHGRNLRHDFASVRLQYGDTLLVEGTETAVARLQESRDFLMLQDVAHEMPRRSKRWVAVGALAGVVMLATLNVLPISVAALLGVLAVIVTGCLNVEEAYDSLDWPIVVFIFGMLSLGMALEKVQGVQVFTRTLVETVGGFGPWAVLSTLLLATSLLTMFLSNNAVAVLVTPICIQVAVQLEVNPRPFLVAVALGASACFATPIGYQTNTLVYGAGGYRFWDFLRVGLPLNLLFWALGSLLIPWIWPFR